MNLPKPIPLLARAALYAGIPVILHTAAPNAAAEPPPVKAETLEELRKPQPWTDKTGRVIIATAKSLNDKEVVLVTANGQEAKVAVGQLSAVSLAALQILFAPAPVASSAPAAPTVTSVAVTDKDTIKAAVGTEITIEGKVKSASQLNGGHVRVNFADTNDFVLFIQKRHVDASADWNFDALAGKTVRVKGKIVEYQEKLEILPEKPEQIEKID